MTLDGTLSDVWPNTKLFVLFVAAVVAELDLPLVTAKYFDLLLVTAKLKYLKYYLK